MTQLNITVAQQGTGESISCTQLIAKLAKEFLDKGVCKMYYKDTKKRVVDVLDDGVMVVSLDGSWCSVINYEDINATDFITEYKD